MKNLPCLRISILIAAVIFSGLAYAHSGAKGVVKQRMDAMSDIAKNMKIIGTMIKSQEINPSVFSDAALKIQQHSSQISELFPKDSIKKPSEALPTIWSEWDEFVKIANKLDSDARTLATMATDSSDKNELKAQFQLVAKSCSGCHEKYRLKTE